MLPVGKATYKDAKAVAVARLSLRVRWQKKQRYMNKVPSFSCLVFSFATTAAFGCATDVDGNPDKGEVATTKQAFIFTSGALDPAKTQYVSFQSVNFPDRYLRHAFYYGEITSISGAVESSDAQDASFKMVPGLNGGGTVSFEAVNFPGYYLRHQDYRVKLQQFLDGRDALFRADASFISRDGISGASGTTSFEASNFPGYYIRHSNFHLFLNPYDGTSTFLGDATFIAVPAFYAPPEATFLASPGMSPMGSMAWDVPAEIDALLVESQGGSGGRGHDNSDGSHGGGWGGKGARVTAVIPVMPGQTLVFQQGQDGAPKMGLTSFGGSGGAAAFVATAIRDRRGVSLRTPLLVAAGGGGGGGAWVTGAGGTGGDAGQWGGSGHGISSGGGGGPGSIGAPGAVGSHPGCGSDGTVTLASFLSGGTTSYWGGDGGGGYLGGGPGGTGDCFWNSGAGGGGGGASYAVAGSKSVSMTTSSSAPFIRVTPGRFLSNPVSYLH